MYFRPCWTTWAMAHWNIRPEKTTSSTWSTSSMQPLDKKSINIYQYFLTACPHDDKFFKNKLIGIKFGLLAFLAILGWVSNVQIQNVWLWKKNCRTFWLLDILDLDTLCLSSSSLWSLSTLKKELVFVQEISNQINQLETQIKRIIIW